MNSSLDALVKNLVEPGRNISNDVLKQRFYNTYQLCDSNEKFKDYFKAHFFTLFPFQVLKNDKRSIFD